MSSSENQDSRNLPEFDLEVATTVVGGSAGEADDVETDVAEDEKDALRYMINQHLSRGDKSRVSLGSVKEELVGDSSPLTKIQSYVLNGDLSEQEEENDEETPVEVSEDDFIESSQILADSLHKGAKENTLTDVNRSRIYIVSADISPLTGSEDNRIASIVKVKDSDTIGIHRTENEEEGDETTDEEGTDNKARFVRTIEQLDKILISPDYTRNEGSVFTSIQDGEQNGQETKDTLIKFYQKNQSDYFENFVAEEVRPNTKVQLREVFSGLEVVKEGEDLTTEEFDKLFEENDEITGEDVAEVAAEFNNIEDEEDAEEELREELERPSFDSLSAEASEAKKPGKVKYTIKEADKKEEIKIKFDSKIGEKVDITEEDGVVKMEVKGNIDDIDLV